MKKLTNKQVHEKMMNASFQMKQTSEWQKWNSRQLAKKEREGHRYMTRTLARKFKLNEGGFTY